MKKKVIFGISAGMFLAAIAFNFNLVQSNNGGEISLEEIAVMAQAGDEKTESNDPVPVERIRMGDGSVMQYESNGSYYQYTQDATKYYDPQTRGYFYQADAPRTSAPSNEPWIGCEFVEPMPTGAIF